MLSAKKGKKTHPASIRKETKILASSLTNRYPHYVHQVIALFFATNSRALFNDVAGENAILPSPAVRQGGEVNCSLQVSLGTGGGVYVANVIRYISYASVKWISFMNTVFCLKPRGLSSWDNLAAHTWKYQAHCKRRISLCSQKQIHLSRLDESVRWGSWVDMGRVSRQ